MVKQNPWAENVAGKLPQMLAEIGTLDMWCTKFGVKKGDTWNTMERVARLVSEGAKTWRFYPTIAMLREKMLGCTVIESTWWILLRSENKTDDLLYKHLSEHTRLASAVRSFAVQANPEGRPQSGKTAARSVVS